MKKRNVKTRRTTDTPVFVGLGMMGVAMLSSPLALAWGMEILFGGLFVTGMLFLWGVALWRLLRRIVGWVANCYRGSWNNP